MNKHNVTVQVMELGTEPVQSFGNPVELWTEDGNVTYQRARKTRPALRRSDSLFRQELSLYKCANQKQLDEHSTYNSLIAE